MSWKHPNPINMSERSEWLARPAKEELAKKLKVLAWVVSALVLALVAIMQRVRLPLPEGVDLSFLPGFYAGVNALAALVLVAAIVFIKQGKVGAHRAAMMFAMVLSVFFLLSYVAYHLTSDPTRYGGEGPMRTVYFLLLITHIITAAVSFPFILFTFIAAWTNRFDAHRRLARWVFPLWLYVAVTGPIIWWMIRPFYD
jgi:putative membrane protein